MKIPVSVLFQLFNTLIPCKERLNSSYGTTTHIRIGTIQSASHDTTSCAHSQHQQWSSQCASETCKSLRQALVLWASASHWAMTSVTMRPSPCCWKHWNRVVHSGILLYVSLTLLNNDS